MNQTVKWGFFEWDPLKDWENVEKHGIGFLESIEAFQDPNRVITFDKKHSQLETRYFCFGKVGKRILAVRYTRRGEIIRIFGAGFWTSGRKIYEKENQKKKNI